MSDAPPKTSRKRRWLRRLLLGALLLLALLAALAVGTYGYLTSGAGEELVRARALDAANEQLKGKLEARKVELSSERLVLEGLKLFDPEGNLVAEIARLEVELRPRELLGGEYRLRLARVVGPKLYLKLDDRGLNLARALEAKQLRPSDLTGTKGPATPFAFRLDRLELEDGSVDFVQEVPGTEEPDRHLRATGLRASAKDVLYATLPDRIALALGLTGQLELPTQGPIDVQLSFDQTGRDGKGSATVRVAEARAALKASMQGTERATLELTELEVDPATARAFLPTYPLLATAELKGTVSQQGNVFNAALVAKAGEANVSLEGGFDLARFRARQLKVSGKGINLEELVAGGPPTALSLELLADGGGTNLRNLEGNVSLHVPRSTVRGQPVGPIRLLADAGGGRFKLSELTALLPGAQLLASGEGNLEQAELSGELTAADLSLLAATLGRLGGGEPLALSGHGKLRFRAKGPTRHPGLEVDGAFSRLSYGDNRVSGLELKAQLRDVTRPLEADATLKARRVEVGERAFDDLSADVRTRGRALSAAVTAHGLTDLVVQAGGLLDEDSQGLDLEELEVRYPEATWQLEAPSHLRWPEGEVTVPKLSLSAGPQRLVATAQLRGERLRANVVAERLDLARLPAALIDKRWNLAGAVGLTVEATGRLPRPSVTAQVKLEDGAFQELKDVQLALQGAYERDRLKGTLELRAEPGALTGTFDAPLTGLLKRRHEPLEVTVDVPELDLRKLVASAGRADPVEGTVAATLRATGYADDPRLTLEVKGKDVRHGELPPKGEPGARFTLNVMPTEEAGRLAATLDVDGYRSHAVVALKTPFTVAGLRAKPPTADELLQTPVELSVDADRVELSALAPDASGTATLKLEAHGTARAPEGTAQVRLSQARRGAMKPLDGTVELEAGSAAVRLTSKLTHAAGPLVDLRASIQGAVRDLLLAERRELLPLEVQGALSPVTLAALKSLAGQPPDDEQELKGTVSAQLRASGTLADPRFQLEGVLDELGLSANALGRVGLTWVYSAAQHTGVVILASPSGGSCDLRVRTRLDVSAPALRRPLDWEAAPLEGSVDARQFDLAFLSGIHPKLRAIAGRLDATGSVRGSVGSPTYTGAAEWKEGRLALMGYGDHRKIHLKLLATNDRVYLEDFSAQSGGGKLQLTADARRSGAVYGLTLSGTMDKYPLIMDDQLFAIASLRTTARGEASSRLVNITELALPEAHLELPQIKRKDLQDLDRPDDIVLVRDGQLIDKKQAKRRAERLAEESARRAQPQGGAAASAEEEKDVGTEYRVVINARRNLWVHGADINAELGLSEEFRLEYQDKLQLFGSVFILQGRTDVLGRRFDVQKDSQVRFQGPAKSPFINVTAVYGNEREQVTVFMNIRGQGTEITLKPTSQPPLSESEIWTLLATGRRQLKRGSGSSMTGAEAATIVSSALASELRKTLPGKVPLDVLSLEAGEEGLVGAKLEAGTYVTDKIYVGYTGRVGANPQKGENSHAVRFEYQFSPRWSFESSWGDANAGGADIVWTRDY